MFDKNRLTKLREEMKKNGDKSYIILTGDPHSSEYVASKFIAERFYFSPFTGSDGSLVVTLDGAYLFTDGRYFIQAEKELADSSVTLMKMGTKGCPTIAEFIAQNDLYPTAGNLFYMPEGFYEGVAKNGIVNDRDYSYLVENKPELSKDKVFALDEKLFTLSFKEKVAKVASEIENKGADSIIITTLDDIAYICGGENNGSDVTDFWCFNPATGTWKELRELYDKSDDDYDDDYTSIVRSYACAFVIDGKGYLAAGQTAGGSYRSNYWIYDPLTDLWDGEDLTDFEGSTRSKAVCFSTGKRGIIATGGASTYYYDDTWELKPYEYEEK